jgi:hypothetical protein
VLFNLTLYNALAAEMQIEVKDQFDWRTLCVILPGRLLRLGQTPGAAVETILILVASN